MHYTGIHISVITNSLCPSLISSSIFMEDEFEDEFGELYADVLPGLHFPQDLDKKFDTSNAISSKNGNKERNCGTNFCVGELKLEHEVEMESRAFGDLKLIEHNENKDSSCYGISQLNNDLADDNYDKKEKKKLGTDSISIRIDEQGVGDESCFNSVAFVSEIKKCDSDKILGFDNLESHPLVLELMNSTSDDDICGDGDDEINQNVLKIASDCGIGYEDGDDESDSGDDFDLIMNDEDFARYVKDTGKGICKRGVLANAAVLATPYDDDDLYHVEGQSIDHGSSYHNVSHTRSEFALPSHQKIFDFNIDELKEKRWRRPGVDLTDYFNFGFDELEWKNYCTKIKIGKNPISTFATSSRNLSLHTGNSHEQPKIPFGEAIQVEIGICERFPSFEAKTLPSSASETVIEIIVLDDDSDKDEISGFVADVDVAMFRNIHVDAIQPLPIDSPYQFFPAVEHTDITLNHEKNQKKYRVEEGSRKGPKKRLSYPSRNYSYKKHESWRNRISDLIAKYGKDKRKDIRRPNRDIQTRIKYRINNLEGSRFKEREKTWVHDRISDTHNNLHFARKRLRLTDSGSDSDSVEEGEIIENETMFEKSESTDCTLREGYQGKLNAEN